MRKRTAALVLFAAMAALILDSRCAADSAHAALKLCTSTLIPTLFPLFVLSSMLVPGLKSLRIPCLSRLLGIPDGSEGMFLLGCAGGFPVGAACIAQAVEQASLSKADGERMLGLCSFCGPSFLFGVIASVLSLPEAVILFVLQLETALLTAVFWPHPSHGACHTASETVSLPEAVRRSISSMASVCAWVVLAGVAAGFLNRWFFPLLPPPLGVLLTGLLELSNGVFALDPLPRDLRFLLCSVFVSFGGVSVLLQIGGLAAQAGLRMNQCAAQKILQSLLSAVLSLLYLRLGIWALFLPAAVLFGKIAVEISGGLLYNSPRKDGIHDAVS
ncbi:MAG: hypothetical protein E7451_05025 [Ruminococcaceae bacterium]|nr:hypothetical protein [Oscillospiraceae bacterium]